MKKSCRNELGTTLHRIDFAGVGPPGDDTDYWVTISLRNKITCSSLGAIYKLIFGIIL